MTHAPGRHRQQEPHSPRPRANRRVGTVVLAAVAAAALAGVTAWGVYTIWTTPSPSPSVATPTWMPVPPASPTPVPATAVPGDRILDVGPALLPGVYRTAGPISPERECYYARLSRDPDEPTIVTVIQDGYADGPTSVIVKASDDAFRSRGCRPWVREPVTTTKGTP